MESTHEGSGFTEIVPCGKCVLCLKRRQKAWSFRLYEEMKVSTSACFLTLTYEDPPLSFNGLPTLDKADFQKFMKRLRRILGKSKLKYYACGEYGSRTQRPHYHAIVFNLPHTFISDGEKIAKVWNKGHIHIGDCNIRSIAYTTKYLMKGRFEAMDDYDDRLPEFSLMSKKMGLSYLTPSMYKHHKNKMISFVTRSGGQLMPLPRYFRDRIFTKEERQELNEEAQRIREIEFEKLFDDAYHELIWKKDLIRKTEKSILERSKI